MSQLPQETRTALPIASRIGAIALAVLFLATLPLLWNAFDRLAFLLQNPYPNDGLEGTLLYEARLLWSGEPLYQPLERYRFVSAPYSPLHPVLVGLADRIPGAHVFWSGRLVSLIAALATTLLVMLTARRAGGSWAGGALGAALFLSAPPVILWATRIKPDLLALCWTALGLYLVTRALSLPGRGQGAGVRGQEILLAACCFALAFFSKQTALMAPLAAGLALLIADLRAFLGGERRGYLGRLPLRPRTLIFGTSYLLLTLGTWLLLDMSTAGQFSAHVWGLHHLKWTTALMTKFLTLITAYWPLMLLGIPLAIYAARDDHALVPLCYLLLVPLSLLGAGETGANHNHLLESLLALTIAGGLVAGKITALARTRLPAALALIIIFAAQIVLAQHPPTWYQNELVPHDLPERYLVFIRNTPGEILADNVGLLIAAGRTPRYDDPAGMGPAAISGVWDQRGLLEDIAQQRFSAIMIPVDVERETEDPTGRWTPEMLAAIRAHYQLKFNDTIDIYVPRQ